jgi:hypothetical protein
MAKYGSPDFDIIQSLQNELRDLRRRVGQLENAKTITAPVYVKSSLNQRDLIPGQLIVGKDNTLNYCAGTVNQVSVYEIQGTLYTTL